MAPEGIGDLTSLKQLDLDFPLPRRVGSVDSKKNTCDIVSTMFLRHLTSLGFVLDSEMHICRQKPLGEIHGIPAKGIAQMT